MELLKTAEFDAWLKALKDSTAKARILARLRRMVMEDRVVGDCKAVGEKVFEMRFHVGPGYRVYFTSEGDLIVLLLLGGDKSSQRTDIEKAQRLARQWRAEL